MGSQTASSCHLTNAGEHPLGGSRRIHRTGYYMRASEAEKAHSSKMGKRIKKDHSSAWFENVAARRASHRDSTHPKL